MFFSFLNARFLFQSYYAIMEDSPPTKVLFLDCDGVISPFTGPLFSEIHMLRLKTIIESTGAKIVLSSAWRLSEAGRLMVNSSLANYGILPCIDITPDLPQSRSDEILSWLNANKKKYNIVNFVALDDIDLVLCAPDREFFSKHAVKTDAMLGLTDEDVKTAILLMNDSKNFV